LHVLFRRPIVCILHYVYSAETGLILTCNKLAATYWRLLW